MFVFKSQSYSFSEHRDHFLHSMHHGLDLWSLESHQVTHFSTKCY